LREARDNADERMKELLEELVTLANGKPTMIGNSKLVKTQRKGSVKYASVVKEHCPDVDLAPYTGAPTEFWSVKGC
jgi:hypothetical protein